MARVSEAILLGGMEMQDSLGLVALSTIARNPTQVSQVSNKIIFASLSHRTERWQLRLDLLVEMFKRFCYMSKLWDF